MIYSHFVLSNPCCIYLTQIPILGYISDLRLPEILSARISHNLIVLLDSPNLESGEAAKDNHPKPRADSPASKPQPSVLVPSPSPGQSLNPHLGGQGQGQGQSQGQRQGLAGAVGWGTQDHGQTRPRRR